MRISWVLFFMLFSTNFGMELKKCFFSNAKKIHNHKKIFIKSKNVILIFPQSKKVTIGEEPPCPHCPDRYFKYSKKFTYEEFLNSQLDNAKLNIKPEDVESVREFIKRHQEMECDTDQWITIDDDMKVAEKHIDSSAQNNNNRIQPFSS